MKKSILILGLAFVTAGLSSCSNVDDTNRGYTLVTYNLNYDNQTYMTGVVKDGENLIKPNNPFRQDYVFNGWYLDDTCSVEFDGFNKTLDQDCVLYAKWSPYNDLTSFEKAQYFIDTLSALEGNVSSTFRESKLVYQQAIVPTDGPIFAYQEDLFERYSDTTIDKTYAYVDDLAQETSLVATTQYTNDAEKVYKVVKDEVETAKSYRQEGSYDALNHESIYSIGFTNLNLGDLRNYISLEGNTKVQIADANVDGLNITGLDYNNTLKFAFTYTVTVKSEELGLLTTIYDYEGEINFLNQKIRRSVVRGLVGVALGEELLTVQEVTDNCEYTVTNEYTAFQGEKFNPKDYPLKQEPTA